MEKQPELILASSSPRRQELIRTLGLPVRVVVSDADETVAPGTAPDAMVEQLALRKAMATEERLTAADAAAAGAKSVIIGADTIVVLNGTVYGKPLDEEDAFGMLKRLQGAVHQVYTGVACIDRHMDGSAAQSVKTGVASERLSNEPMRRYTGTGEPTGETEAKLATVSETITATAAGTGTEAGTEAETGIVIGTDTEAKAKSEGEKRNVEMRLGDIGRYRVIARSPGGEARIVAGHTVSKVTFRPMSDEEIRAYVKTGEPLDKAGSYGVQGVGAVFIEKLEGDFYSVMGLPLNLLYQMLLTFEVSPLA